MPSHAVINTSIFTVDRTRAMNPQRIIMFWFALMASSSDTVSGSYQLKKSIKSIVHYTTCPAPNSRRTRSVTGDWRKTPQVVSHPRILLQHTVTLPQCSQGRLHVGVSRTTRKGKRASSPSHILSRVFSVKLFVFVSSLCVKDDWQPHLGSRLFDSIQ